jgi:hypothetical protein
VVEVHRQRGELLGRRIVKVARNAPPFLVLQMKQAAGQSLIGLLARPQRVRRDLAFDPHADVTAETFESTRERVVA